jgi:hypothetical protein
MAVPDRTGDPAIDHLVLMIRRHEILHARYSKKFTRIHPQYDQCLQWAEDWRITQIGLRAGILATTCNRYSECAICHATRAGIITGLTHVLTALKCPDPKEGAEIVISLLQIEYEPRYGSTEADLMARRLVLKTRRKYLDPLSGRTLKTVADRLMALLFAGGEKLPRPAMPSRRGGEDGRPDWGHLDVSYAHLSRTAARPSVRAYRPSEDGAIPTAMYRATLDNRVFRRKVRQSGASVLIDGSGSMSWEDGQIEDVLEVCPASVVGLYEADSYRGTLHVLAERGQHTAELPHMRGSNCVDGPALEWLARQPEPRYWVSDGGVTERGDRFSVRASREADALCLAHKITRVRNGSDLIDRLQKSGGHNVSL